MTNRRWRIRPMTESRYVTEERGDPERFHLYRLCDCTTCGATGKVFFGPRPIGGSGRCEDCRGEGRTVDLVATCATPEAVGVALVTLGREGEWDKCPVGVLDTQGATGEKWIVRPWLPSARNTSQAGRVLQSAQRKGEEDMTTTKTVAVVRPFGTDRTKTKIRVKPAQRKGKT